MKAYCPDTCGLSSPLEHMPEDIHPTLWASVQRVIVEGKFAVTTEIYGELVNLPGQIGKCIADNKSQLQLEIEEDHWDWQTYLGHVEDARDL